MDEERKQDRELTGFMKQVAELNVDFYKLFYDLKENKEALGKPQIYDFMLQKLFDLYKHELERIYIDYELEFKREMFIKETRFDSLVPHAWRFLCFHHENIPAKLIMENVDIKSDKFFKECEAENDAARPSYMDKIWLTRQDKREAKRKEKEARKAANRIQAVQIPEKSSPTAALSSEEAKKQARLRALEERRKANNSPKAGKQ